MDPVSAMAIYGGGAAISALGSYFGGQSQADAMKEVNKRNEALTREAWSRDDTAIARRVQDLKNSGLNPALAAGSAASTSSPIPMQSEVNTGPAEATKSAGQSISAWPMVEQTLKRNAAATLQAQAQANLTANQARIAAHDASMIEQNKDPRNRGVIDQLLSGIPKLVQAVKENTPKMGEFIHGSPGEIKRADDMMKEALRLQKKGGAENMRKANAIIKQVEAIQQGGYQK